MHAYMQLGVVPIVPNTVKNYINGADWACRQRRD